MPTIERRTFLIGLPSMIASAAIAGQEIFLGAIATGTLHPALRVRNIMELVYSSMPTGEEISSPRFVEDPVRWTFLRNDDVVHVNTVNPRATMRWVSFREAAIEIPENVPVRVMVEPCHTFTTLMIGSNIERNPLKPERIFYECYRWRNGKAELDDVTAAKMSDASMLRDA